MTAGVSLAAGLLTLASLPARAVDAGASDLAGLDVRVAYHVHSRRSDGSGTIDDIAAAAARAGIAAVILTDHGDATRAPDPPVYRSGTLVIDGVEVSTWGGHYVALGARPSPYPLGGEPAATVADIARLGGFGVAAHPSSEKEALRWRAWDAPFDAIEWLNGDSAWREEPARLWRTLLTYPWRPAESVAALVHTPEDELAAWDRAADRRQVVGLVAHDAHARLGLGASDEPRDDRFSLAVPSYEQMFRAFTNIVRVPAPLEGDARRDAAAVLSALRGGRVYGVITGVARPGRFVFRGEADGRLASFGEALQPRGRTRLVVEADVPPGATTRVVCRGAVVAEASGGRLIWETVRPPGACRAEILVQRGGHAVPWLVSNPVYARQVLEQGPPAEAPAPLGRAPLAGAPDSARWVAELRPGSEMTAAPAPAGGVDVRYQLGPAAAPPPYAALRLDLEGPPVSYDRLIVRGHADRPMRVWVQLRAPTAGGQRWGRSVYLDATSREVELPFSTLLSLGDALAPAIRVSEVTALLLVVDTTYAVPGGAGQFSIESIALAR